ncbi:hypothetical protein Z946_3934 [Sulfitobacter noctilucicola]|uniref:Uncharacterized protein n=1 Tax=Sulfitobacter noctilucicola TaxID=1342301 RepID=A0A7W6M7F0_9RHOB|nr:hypothetical protein [Sulfitobacter noctilucicola]KIN65037.1 hypothetical protein Z946_3934 [Sulfitobacter noctilucicola]MBB4173824.1 hypothetical protein [Sulfitobacter noctilucicola]
MFAMLRGDTAGQAKVVRERYLDDNTSEQLLNRGLASFQDAPSSGASAIKKTRDRKIARFGFSLERFKL